MKKIFIIIMMLAFEFVVAGITQDQIEFKTESKTIELVPKKGFHINDKAPASAIYDNAKVINHPQIKTEQKMVYTAPSKTKKADLKYFVCDDAKTVCEQHTKEIIFEKESAPQKVLKKATASPDSALAKFTDSKKPTLLIFSAPWCPACIRMASEVYPTKSVKNIFSKLNVQKINIDLIENEKIGEQFSVHAIPTLILLNTSGQEIYRWLDYQPAERFSKQLVAQSKNKDAIETVKTKADAGDLRATETLAKIYFGQMDWQNAAKYFGQLKDEDSQKQKINCEVSFLSDNKDKGEVAKKEYIAGLEKAIGATTSKIDRLRWQVDLLEARDLKKDTAEKTRAEKIILELNEVIQDKKLSQYFAEATFGDMSGFEAAESLDMRARVEDFLNKLDDKKKTQQQISENILSKKQNLSYPGQVINSIGYLNSAEKFTEAEKLIQQLVEKYPKTYVYHQRYASHLLRQNRSKEALEQINLALTYQEGNVPQLSLQKIKILKALDQKEQALKLTEDVLKIIEVAPDKYKRTKTALLDYQKEFSKK
jgi:thiol-disulfide isomerase/thioredoxin